MLISLISRYTPPHLIRNDLGVDFIGKKFWAFGISLTVLTLTLFFFFTRGLNLGIDFGGGSLIEAQFTSAPKVEEIRSRLSALNIGEVAIQEITGENTVLLRLQKQAGDDSAQQAAVNRLRSELDKDKVEYRRIESVGPQVGKELVTKSIIAVGIALLGILIYVWFRFEWQFGVAAVIATFHDVLSIIGLYAITRLQFDLTSLAAILLVAGYSINDTVVVFDRIREMMRKHRTMPINDIFNLSVNSTLSRTILTSSTVVLSLIVLFFFGGEALRGFVIALFWGIVFGTYSSIFVATPLLTLFGIKDADAIKPLDSTATVS